MGAGPVVAALCFVLSRAWYFLFSLSAYRRLIGDVQWRSLDARAGFAMLKEGLPYGVFVAMGTLYFQIDTVLVQHFLGPRGVGLCQAGARLLMGALIVPEVICTAYLPAIAAVVQRDETETARLGARMTRHLLMLGVVGMAIFALGAQWIVSGFYGHDYDPVVTLLPAFGLVLLLRFVASSYGLLLTVADRQLARSGVVAGAFLVRLAVNVVLIPRYGLRGAVLASVATHVFLLGAYAWFVVRELRHWFVDGRGAGLIALAGLAWLLVPASPAVRLVGGLAILAGAVTAGVRSAEWRRLAQALPSLVSGLESS